MKTLLPSIIACALLLCCSCSEKIEITSGTHTTQIVIFAMFNNEPSVQTVTLSQTVAYFSVDSPPVVTGAQVYVQEDGGEWEELMPSAEHANVFLTRPDFAISAGKTYRLRVLHAGSEYTAQDIAPHGIHLRDDVNVIPMNNETGAAAPRLQPTFAISGWVERDNLNDIHVRVSHRYNGKKMREKLSQYAVGEIPAGSMYSRNPAFAPMLTSVGTGWFMVEGGADTLYYAPFDTVGIQMHVLSNNLFRYIASVKHESGGSNPMFGGVPSNLESNISGGAVGIFGTYISGNIVNVTLPLNYRSFDRTRNYVWHSPTSPNDSIAINISNGRALYACPDSIMGMIYFDSIQPDTDNHLFTAKKYWVAGGELFSRRVRFRPVNYFEFWEIPEDPAVPPMKYLLQMRRREESIMSVLMILV